MSSDAPLYPTIAACMVLSGVGIVVLTFSDNSPLKRRIFPGILAICCLAASLLVWGSDRLGGGTLGKAGLIALLVAGALWSYTQIGFCVDCGVTMRRQKDGEVRCPNCIAKRRTIQ